MHIIVTVMIIISSADVTRANVMIIGDVINNLYVMIVAKVVMSIDIGMSIKFMRSVCGGKIMACIGIIVMIMIVMVIVIIIIIEIVI